MLTIIFFGKAGLPPELYSMQTILGAGGAIGQLLAKELATYTTDIRLVSRNPRKVNAGDELVTADLTVSGEVDRAVEDSEVVYLTAGVPYSTEVWKKQWPVIMEYVIAACVRHRCRLVFFDNLYSYDGSDLSDIRETNPVNPPSQKGKVRAAVVAMIWEAVKNRGLVALVARSADFYGPEIKGASMLTETVINPLKDGKTANWMVGGSFRHSFTFTPDAAKATALLGNTSDAYGQTWHLPTAANPLTGKEWIERIAAELGVKPRYRIVSRLMIRVLGLFIPVLRESYEMLYQYDRDYVFNSEKFEKRFDVHPTPYLEGIRQVLRAK